MSLSLVSSSSSVLDNEETAILAHGSLIFLPSTQCIVSVHGLFHIPENCLTIVWITLEYGRDQCYLAQQKQQEKNFDSCSRYFSLRHTNLALILYHLQNALVEFIMFSMMIMTRLYLQLFSLSFPHLLLRIFPN